jgi:hypothetical protein
LYNSQLLHIDCADVIYFREHVLESYHVFVVSQVSRYSRMLLATFVLAC